jgi:two-component system alkaline phosphatase synthesis response regulator PhoP
MQNIQTTYTMSLIVDSVRHTVTKDSNQIKDLTRREFQILWYLCQDPGRVYTREQIFHQIWGDQVKSHDRTVDVHIVQLRRKIDKSIIKSIKGVGYKINLEKEEVRLIQ